jgi:predicted O-linked N-acetylglucosamine transferase (SPINDLY family)
LLLAGSAHNAAQQLRIALRRDPNDVQALNLLTLALTRLRDFVGAEWAARRLTDVLPHDHRAWHNLGNLLVDVGRAEEAITPLLRAQVLAPDEPQTAIALSNAYMNTNQWTRAQEACAEAVANHPHESRLVGNLALALHGAGRIEEALPLARRARKLAPLRIEHADALAAMSTYSPDVSARESLVYHTDYASILECTPIPQNRRAAGAGQTDRITIGLLSPDLRDHAVAKFTRPVIEYRERERTRLICYSTATREDDISRELRGMSDGWFHAPAATSSELASRIMQDGVDVLVDLAGHTRGHRLDVFALRPARVQATWMGYPNTTGLSRMDYRIVDAISDPPGAEEQNSERLAKIAPCLVSFPPQSRTRIGRRESTTVRFASFSSLLKWNAPLLRAWSEIMLQTPGSTITLLHHALADTGVREHVLSRFQMNGIGAHQVRFLEPVRTSAGVLPLYQDVDIALDTFPYTGTTTTCEALSMGVPVVTRTGETSASRVGQSLLGAAGVPELCARSEQEYIQISIDLAKSPQRLRAVREQIARGFADSDLANVRRFGEEMSRLLVELAQSPVQ